MEGYRTLLAGSGLARADIWTSARMASWMSYESLAIRRNGRSPQGYRFSPRSELLALAAIVQGTFRRDAGDEIVCLAYR
jgi:hypothetical protein